MRGSAILSDQDWLTSEAISKPTTAPPPVGGYVTRMLTNPYGVGWKHALPPRSCCGQQRQDVPVSAEDTFNENWIPQ